MISLREVSGCHGVHFARDDVQTTQPHWIWAVLEVSGGSRTLAFECGPPRSLSFLSQTVPLKRGASG